MDRKAAEIFAINGNALFLITVMNYDKHNFHIANWSAMNAMFVENVSDFKGE